jgi:DNA-binding NtrC family response regulator
MRGIRLPANKYDVPVMKVLIVDDREDYLRALEAALHRDFEIVCAASMIEARQAMSATIDAALVDVRLSEQDPMNREGVALLQWMKLQNPSIPVLMMSAYKDVDALTTLDAGADYFFRKPIDVRELASVLREFAERGLNPEKTANLKRQLVWSFAHLHQPFRPFHKGLEDFSRVRIQRGVAENPLLPGGVT